MADGNEQDVDPALLVDVVNAQFGGAHRAVHAVGIGLTGRFTPAADAKSFCRAAIFTGDPVGVTARFSNSDGTMKGDDRIPDVRGLAVRFHVADNSSLDMVAMTLNGFFARTPEEFVEFSRLNVPDPGTGVVNADALREWLMTHPGALMAFMVYQQLGVDVTYGGLTFHGVHAFNYVNDRSATTTARFSWVPDQPVASLPRDTDTSSYPKDFLRRDITERARSGNAPGFTLRMQLQGPGDPESDPTQVWRSTNVRDVGHLQLGGLVADQYWDCEALRFNPTRVIDGIELSSDPVLHARRNAYETSAGRRTAAYPVPSELPDDPTP